MKLYNFFRSGTSYRTRIALNLKGVAYDYVPVNLANAENWEAHYLAINPQGLVPALQLDDGTVLTQSVAILEWLEDTYPQQPLLPQDLAAMIGSDIHPLNNKRILAYLRHELGQDETAVQAWIANWIQKGFSAIETLLAHDTKRHPGLCFGDTPTLADVYLVPQVYSARRFNVDLSAFPLIVAVDAHCNRLDAFKRAHPDNQLDTPKA